MNKLFYPKLAATNLKKNSKTYVPYILTCICTVIMYYIMYAMSTNHGLDKTFGGEDLKQILALGSKVIAIFSVIFLFYTNSFLVKRRKKEFGMFNILGMEKRHLAKMMLYETLYVAVTSLVIGIFTGIILSKLMFLVLLKILDLNVQMGFEISVSAIISSLILFSCIFVLTLLNSLRQIHLAKPIELLKGGQTGEKEPKTKWLLVLIGLITLGGGYYISLTTTDPLAAIQLFFVAVILVIIGTYCLFTAGSIALLKLLRKKKNYYYKTKHFISVSGMMYRMKQNAVGLANICILSTMVLVIISTTVSLYIGVDDAIRTRYPRNIMITSSNISDDYRKEINNAVSGVLNKHNLTAKNTLDFRYFAFEVTENEGEFTYYDTSKGGTYVDSDLRCMYVIPLEDYNTMTGSAETLEKNEILIYSNRDPYKEDTCSIFQNTFTVKKRLDSFIGAGSDGLRAISSHYIIVKDISILNEIMAKQVALNTEDENKPTAYLGFDLNVSDEECIEVYGEIGKALSDCSESMVESAAESRSSIYTLYGGLLFLGIFLGILFMMATILIIYYKQISEGYDDKERFEIMQKVGLSRDEVKKTIHSQVLTVFFLPLITAVIHIIFAFPVITKLLEALNLTNVTLFAICTVVTILIFALFYGIVYTITAREYYRIVQ